MMRRVGRVGGVAALVAASVALVVVAIVAFSAGRLSTLADPIPTDTSAEAGFARDMQVHHQQGTELAMIVRDLTEDREVRLLAYDIATTQAQQAGQLHGWLRVWGLSQRGSEPSMTWMTRPASEDGHTEHDNGSGGGTGDGDDGSATHGHGDLMPGLATPEQIRALETSTGVEAERRFLELMIAHHRGAIEMAYAALAQSSNGVVVPFAESIVESQSGEIILMEDMLERRS
jgi:uncharacterized protein (DUF305 family)